MMLHIWTGPANERCPRNPTKIPKTVKLAYKAHILNLKMFLNNQVFAIFMLLHIQNIQFGFKVSSLYPSVKQPLLHTKTKYDIDR